MNIDITDIRDMSVEMHGLENADKEYTLFYDETNNPRRVKLTEDGFNHDIRDFFILGGLVFDKENIPSDEPLKELFSQLGVTKDMKEIKFKHVRQKAKDFLNLIKKRRVKTFIKWMYDNEYWVHYSYRDNFYYSIVDIVDSMSESFFGGFGFSQSLKTSLYENGKKDRENFLNILKKYNYPNVKEQRDFIEELVNWIDYTNWNEDEGMEESFELEYLRQSLRGARKTGLPFLTNNTDNVTIEDFSDLYFNRFSILINSEHIYDKEYEIQEKLDKLPFVYNGELLNNYKFIDSDDSMLIQLSDVLLGILRMLFRYVEENEPTTILLNIVDLENEEKETLGHLQAIMLKSIEENIIFKHGSASEEFERKLKIFFDYPYLQSFINQEEI